MTLKVHTPDPEEEREALMSRVRKPTAPRRLKTSERCRCGCGKRAKWSDKGPPLFHTRLCGYLFACKIIRGKARSGA